MKEAAVPLYEHVFLARQDLSQAQVDALAATATEIVEANQGKVTKTETWGLKNLAYKIKRNRKAHFVLLNIEAPAGVIAELERQTAINEDVIRWLTVRVDEHESGPSVQMRKSDRDDRRAHRDRAEHLPLRQVELDDPALLLAGEPARRAGDGERLGRPEGPGGRAGLERGDPRQAARPRGAGRHCGDEHGGEQQQGDTAHSP